ncbi:EAL domain-containing protein [Niveibacterium sp. 24ML]|uniref:putative bifunctional diguanylate cyclase/phosphodiesterase n=1 Tax=Niveibacterium sp. 24ML TaxID=2985512 RepID=UPI00226F0EBB|nr:GGDEF and EAL domain-containing protein [Niveibacterium sp. 24ML]MCX9158170.1 EAL domain-containing protein [Niveibacterium sp. 24ML]
MTSWVLLAFVIGLPIAFWLGARRADKAMLREREETEDSRTSALAALAQTRLLQAHQQALMDSIDDLAWLKDRDCRFKLVNRKFADVFGSAPASLVGKTDYDLSPPEMAAHYQAHDRMVMETRQVARYEEEIHRENGEIGWAETIKVPVFGENGEVVGTAGIARDITLQKRYQREVEFLAQHDPLTGLYNRRHLEDQFEVFAASHTRFAALFLDLDNFKLINDTDGHSVGDELLRQLAARLKGETGRNDLLVRLGGDEFLLLSPLGSDSPDALDDLAGRIETAIGTPYEIGSVKYTVSSSIGIAVYPEHGNDRQTLIKHADIAMYEAKKKGRNRICWFEEALASETVEQRRIELRIREALKEKAFDLHYQPVADTQTARIVGAEALLRLRDSHGAPIPPARFIPVAEQTGLIEAVGEWVLDTGLRQLAAWRAAGHLNFRLAINISGTHFTSPHFVERLAARLRETNVPGSALELELTEGVLMADADANISTLARIAALGVALAVDDFGTGYSSLAYLKQLPIHRLKIDRSFVKGLPVHPGDIAITRSILHLAQTFGFEVTAEGVETREQLEFLREAGCPTVQGFYFSPARSAADFEVFFDPPRES